MHDVCQHVLHRYNLLQIFVMHQAALQGVPNRHSEIDVLHFSCKDTMAVPHMRTDPSSSLMTSFIHVVHWFVVQSVLLCLPGSFAAHVWSLDDKSDECPPAAPDHNPARRKPSKHHHKFYRHVSSKYHMSSLLNHLNRKPGR